MAYVASVSLFNPAVTQDGPRIHNALNYNDFLDRANTPGYWKPRYCAWPRGGYSRKEAINRCVNGRLDTSPGSFEWTTKFTPRGRHPTISHVENPNKYDSFYKSRTRRRYAHEEDVGYINSGRSSGLNLCTNTAQKFRDPDEPPLDKFKPLKDENKHRLVSWATEYYDQPVKEWSNDTHLTYERKKEYLRQKYGVGRHSYRSTMDDSRNNNNMEIPDDGICHEDTSHHLHDNTDGFLLSEYRKDRIEENSAYNPHSASPKTNLKFNKYSRVGRRSERISPSPLLRTTGRQTIQTRACHVPFKPSGKEKLEPTCHLRLYEKPWQVTK